MKRLFLLAVVGGLAYGAWILTKPATPPKSVLIDYERGMPSNTLAAKLGEAGVADPIAFRVARLLRFGKRLQAGEYKFEKPATSLQIVDRLIAGDVHYYEVLIPEGANKFDVADILSRADLGDAAAIVKSIREGSLFPATYRYTKHSNATQLIAQMQTRFDRAWRDLNPGDANRERTVTLASLIEKEAVVAEDRPIIASVFENRLRQGMKLDCDPTVVYAALLEGKYRGTIYRSDLERESAYNTYKVAGLPPGPIANPGLASLRAALKPAQTEYLFFVARPGGGGRHVFSKTLAEHNRAVLEYRRGEQSASTRGTAGGAR
ncbi:MAG: endolytic transglycosylase MltG [Bryobacteraceae bacterium]|nr:endolytic transglycosylase MltG [Bryobacteraceae bacterium]